MFGAARYGVRVTIEGATRRIGFSTLDEAERYAHQASRIGMTGQVLDGQAIVATF